MIGRTKAASGDPMVKPPSSQAIIDRTHELNGSARLPGSANRSNAPVFRPKTKAIRAISTLTYRVWLALRVKMGHLEAVLVSDELCQARLFFIEIDNRRNFALLIGFSPLILSK